MRPRRQRSQGNVNICHLKRRSWPRSSSPRPPRLSGTFQLAAARRRRRRRAADVATPGAAPSADDPTNQLPPASRNPVPGANRLRDRIAPFAKNINTEPSSDDRLLEIAISGRFRLLLAPDPDHYTIAQSLSPAYPLAAIGLHFNRMR